MWLFLPLFYVSKHTPFNSGKKAERRARRDSRHDKTDRQTPGDENSDAVLHHCVGQGEQIESLPPSQVVWVANNWGPPRPRAGRILLCAADSCTQHALPRRDWSWEIALRASEACERSLSHSLSHGSEQMDAMRCGEGMAIDRCTGSTVLRPACHLAVHLVPKFISLNFTIYLSHQIFCLMYETLNIGK